MSLKISLVVEILTAYSSAGYGQEIHLTLQCIINASMYVHIWNVLKKVLGAYL